MLEGVFFRKFGLSKVKSNQSQSVALLQLTASFVSTNTEIQSLPSHETRTSLFSCSKQRVECKALPAYETSPIVWAANRRSHCRRLCKNALFQYFSSTKLAVTHHCVFSLHIFGANIQGVLWHLDIKLTLAARKKVHSDRKGSNPIINVRPKITPLLKEWNLQRL